MTLPATSNVTPVGARLAGAAGLLAVLSLALQAVSLYQGIDGPLAVAPMSRFLVLFAIFAGVLIAITCLAAAMRPDATTLAALPAVRGAAAAYAAFAMIANGLLLESPWIPSGLQLWADIGLNFLVPILYLSWWVWFAPHGALRLLHCVAWWLAPVAMLLLLRVHVTPVVPILLVVICGLVVVVDHILGAAK